MSESENDEKLDHLERFVRELICQVLGMELNDEDDQNSTLGVCLLCGTDKKRPATARCSTCQGEYRTVPGLFGVNNMSQVLQSTEDFRAQKLDSDELQERFGVLLEVWEQFGERWELQGESVASHFALGGELDAVYGKLLEEIEEGVEHLNKAFDLVEDLNVANIGAVDEHIRLFSRRVCSASAGIFTKLESRGGDFSSLLDAFGSI